MSHPLFKLDDLDIHSLDYTTLQTNEDILIFTFESKEDNSYRDGIPVNVKEILRKIFKSTLKDESISLILKNLEIVRVEYEDKDVGKVGFIFRTYRENGDKLEVYLTPKWIFTQLLGING